MSVGAYSYTNLLNQAVDPLKYANIASQLTILNTINRSARMVSAEIDLRSMKRKAALASKLFDNEYTYAQPSDLKGDAVIDVIPQRDKDLRRGQSQIVLEEEFERNKTTFNSGGYLMALATDDLVNRILISGNYPITDTNLSIASLTNLTEGTANWLLFGDATAVATDTGQYIAGNGAVKFDLVGSSTTAGISNIGLGTFDITNYLTDGSIFVWVYINSTTNLTNWILRVGNDITANYYTQTVTTTHESVAFTAGWNLLRFDFASMTQTGTVAPTTCDSVAIYMTKSSGKSDDGYRVNNMVLHSGEYHNILYYSKYPWQSAAGAFIENSTTGTDLLNADTDEFELFVLKGKIEVFKELRDFELMKIAQQDYFIAKANYEAKNPTQRLSKQARAYYDIGGVNQYPNQYPYQTY